MAKTFNTGDKVFAKVRGYPPWPARVESLADATPNKTKYNVFFYGTSETAVCKVEDLFLYSENKEKYGRPLKRKGFNEALAQIEGTAPVPTLPPLPASDGKTGDDADSDAEGALVIDERPRTPVAASKHGRTESTEEKKKVNKRKREAENTPDDVEVKRGKRSSVGGQRKNVVEPRVADNGPTSPSKTEVVSRSGRKIKPKKFADEETFDATVPETAAVPTGKGGNPMEGASIRRRQSKVTNSDSESEKARHMWEKAVMANALRLKTQIESGESIPEHIQSQIERKTALAEKDRQYERWDNLMEKKKGKLRWLKTEARMVEVDSLMKGHLSIAKANADRCLQLLDEMSNLSLDPLMLKKHPQVVETIKRLRKYIGNANQWGFNEDEKVKFASKAHQIRSKAEHVYNKFKAMFTVPEGSTFWQVFSDNVSTFQKATQALPMDKMYSLVIDPVNKRTAKKSSGGMWKMLTCVQRIKLLNCGMHHISETGLEQLRNIAIGICINVKSTKWHISKLHQRQTNKPDCHITNMEKEPISMESHDGKNYVLTFMMSLHILLLPTY